MAKKSLKIAGISTILLVITFMSLFTWVDRSPYTESEYYRKTINRIPELTQGPFQTGDTLKIGWAKVNLTPPNPMPLAGYGKRGGKSYSGIQDSIWVRAFVFDNGLTRTALVAADLLIIPPEVTGALEERLNSLGISNVFYTASHSHSSIGSWAPGITGRLFAGTYNPDIVEWISEKIYQVVKYAGEDTKQASIGYASFKTEGLIYNRLVFDEGTVDPWLRVIQMNKTSGERAIFATFAAHATCFGYSFMKLSGDYPSALVQQLESDPGIDFAAFGAGAVASQGVIKDGKAPVARAKKIGVELAEQVILGLNFMKSDYTGQLQSMKLEVELREPHLRITENIRIRPWVYNYLVGGYPVDLKVLRIGEIMLVGTPCDFSGELVEELELQARRKNISLIITSFNGGYVGYITKDQWYDRDRYETLTMNWYGPYNGAYFSELIGRLIELSH